MISSLPGISTVPRSSLLVVWWLSQGCLSFINILIIIPSSLNYFIKMRVGNSLLFFTYIFILCLLIMNRSTSDFLMANCMIIWMSYSLVHQFPIHGHLGGFQFLSTYKPRHRGTSIYIYFAGFPIGC